MQSANNTLYFVDARYFYSLIGNVDDAGMAATGYNY